MSEWTLGAVLDAQRPQLGGMQVIRLMREMQTAPPAILLAVALVAALPSVIRALGIDPATMLRAE